jgi:acetate kinase
MRKENLSTCEMENFLNKKCGLLGLSGRSADTRELLKHLGERDVDLALNVYSYRVRKYIGLLQLEILTASLNFVLPQNLLGLKEETTR